jgi:polar amino acid transport system substrate-binding protein
MKILHRFVYLLVAVMFLASAASIWADEEESRFDMVIKRDKLIVATYSTAPPLCFKDEKGELVGFEIDIVREIAKTLVGNDKKIEFLIVSSDGRFPAVLSGKADLGIASTTIYPERAMRVAFTTPYMDSGVSLLTRKNVPANSIKELNSEKFTMGGKNNPQSIDRAKRYVPKMKTKWFDSDSAALLALKSGIIDVLQTDPPIADWFALKTQDLRVLPEGFGNLQNNAIFMKPGDFKWWLFLDTTVKEMRYGSRYDVYTDLFRKWFGKSPPPQRFYIGK